MHGCLQTVSRNTSQLGKQQLERLTSEYNNLAALAKQAGVALVDDGMVQVRRKHAPESNP